MYENYKTVQLILKQGLGGFYRFAWKLRIKHHSRICFLFILRTPLMWIKSVRFWVPRLGCDINKCILLMLMVMMIFALFVCQQKRSCDRQTSLFINLTEINEYEAKLKSGSLYKHFPVFIGDALLCSVVLHLKVARISVNYRKVPIFDEQT